MLWHLLLGSHADLTGMLALKGTSRPVILCPVTESGFLLCTSHCVKLDSRAVNTQKPQEHILT